MLTPGPVIDVSTMISLPDADPNPMGVLFITTVYSDMDVSVAEWVGSQFSDHARLMPKGEFIPPSMSPQEYNQWVADTMEESKTVAKIAALTQLGFEVKATGEGARVQKLLPGSKAEGYLQEGDIILEAEGQAIQTATDLVNLVHRLKPGVSVALQVLRQETPVQMMVETRESDTEPGIAVIGILVRTHLFGHNLPIKIDIDSENIGGPSAGLMFTLGIIDRLRGGSLTAGHRVAGTGTISLDGSVGQVGGVDQKVIGAEQAGAEFFLAPFESLNAARRVARRIQVVPVRTIEDAVHFLASLQPTGHRDNPTGFSNTKERRHEGPRRLLWEYQEESSWSFMSSLLRVGEPGLAQNAANW